MRLSGKVKVWFEDRRFGFVKRDDDAIDIFVHASALPENVAALKTGDRIEFDEGLNPHNQRPCALKVQII